MIVLLALVLITVTTGALTSVEAQPTTNDESCESSPGFQSVVSVIKDELRQVKDVCGAKYQRPPLDRDAAISALTSRSTSFVFLNSPLFKSSLYVNIGIML